LEVPSAVLPVELGSRRERSVEAEGRVGWDGLEIWVAGEKEVPDGKGKIYIGFVYRGSF
jgi:hypothetical protein